MEWGDITAMRYADRSVDWFICFHVLEHIPDEGAALAEIAVSCAPEGRRCSRYRSTGRQHARASTPRLIRVTSAMSVDMVLTSPNG